MIKIKVRRITMEIEKINVNIKLTLVIKYIAMAVIIGIISWNSGHNFWQRITCNFRL